MEGGNAVEKEGQVGKQVAILPGKLDELEGSIKLLESRLQAVLKTPTPPSPDGEAKDDESLVPLANTVRQWHRQIQACNGRVCDILDRLEL